MEAVQTRRVVREIPQSIMSGGVMPEYAKKMGLRMQVAAYARVSTEKEEQEDSFERQVTHYKTLITAKPEWELVDIYADPGITGTRAEKRPNFMRMISDCRAGKIQKVLVKSISRFARNTVDALQYIRELKDLGISVYFESENIDTLTPGGEVLITILAAMAEQESRTMSSNIKWSYQKRFAAGNVIINTGLMFGYKKVGKDAEGKDVYEIVEDEAALVRRIYREYLAGITVTQICKELEDEGIKTKLGKSKWYCRTVLNILQNELYIGNATLGKTFKPDGLSKLRMKNTGQVPMYYVEGSHPAIIEKTMYDAVQQEIRFRAAGGNTVAGQSKYTSKYPFSGLLICGNCGTRLRRQIRTTGSGKRIPSWGCARRIRDGRAQCDSHHVNESTLEKTYETAMRKIVDDADDVISAIQECIDEQFKDNKNAELAKIEKQIVVVQEKAVNARKDKLRGAITAAQYATIIEECKTEMQGLEARQKELQESATGYANVAAWMRNFKDSISSGEIVNADNGFIMKQLVEQIIINDEDMEIRFRCGVSVTERYVK